MPVQKKVDVEMNLHAEMDVFFVLESFVKSFSRRCMKGSPCVVLVPAPLYWHLWPPSSCTTMAGRGLPGQTDRCRHRQTDGEKDRQADGETFRQIE